ncbi:unnamed protein product [Lampetra planeri]
MPSTEKFYEDLLDEYDFSGSGFSTDDEGGDEGELYSGSAPPAPCDRGSSHSPRPLPPCSCWSGSRPRTTLRRAALLERPGRRRPLTPGSSVAWHQRAAPPTTYLLTRPTARASWTARKSWPVRSQLLLHAFALLASSICSDGGVGGRIEETWPLFQLLHREIEPTASALQVQRANRYAMAASAPAHLAAIIAGGAVGLLFAVFLILFLVYRMRKKEAGSFSVAGPLPYKTNLAYQKAPNDEGPM